MMDLHFRRVGGDARAVPAATINSPHVRDAMNVYTVMHLLVVAVLPCIVVGMVNAGHQANTAMIDLKLAELPGWRGHLLELLMVEYSPGSVWDNLCHGASYFFPLLLITLAVTIFWEQLFAQVRKRDVTEGALATAILFTLTLPPTLPLWQAALGISFGVVLGREVFGGAGMNIVNPILAGRAFLYFAYPEQITADSIWTAVDGFSGATLLTVAKTEGMPAMLSTDVTWTMAFLGELPGSLGETSTLACVVGGGVLLIAGIISWRIVAGTVIGLTTVAWVFSVIGSDTNPMFALPWYWHLVLGGFAFGAIFLATDPVTSPVTDLGRWFYGLLIGVLVVIIRVTNPAIPEGVMFAILLANIFAPTIDHVVIQANIKRRDQYVRRQLQVDRDG